MTRFFLLVLTVAISACASVTDQEIVCAKFQTENGWSKAYKVEATITSGDELNRASNTLNYRVFSTYVVILLENDRAIAIELKWPYLTEVGQEGEDMSGMKWEIAKTNICI